MNKKFKEGDKVYVNPNDAPVSEGTVIGFQKVKPYHPIVQGTTPHGTPFKNAFDPDNINHFKDGKKFWKWKLVYE